MSYNFIAEKNGDYDWFEIERYFNNVKTQAIEVFPIISEAESEKYLIGISIPYYKLDRDHNFWKVFSEILKDLNQKFGFKIYDLYNGFYINDSNLNRVKDGLYG